MDPLRETAKLSPNDLRDLLAGDVTWLAEAGRGRGDRSVICQNKENNIVDFHENTLTWMTFLEVLVRRETKGQKRNQIFSYTKEKKSDHLDRGKKDTVIEHFSGLMDEKRTRSDHRDWGKKKDTRIEHFPVLNDEKGRKEWPLVLRKNKDKNLRFSCIDGLKKDIRSHHLDWGKKRTQEFEIFLSWGISKKHKQWKFSCVQWRWKTRKNWQTGT